MEDKKLLFVFFLTIFLVGFNHNSCSKNLAATISKSPHSDLPDLIKLSNYQSPMLQGQTSSQSGATISESAK
jgi:hypothetical protein